MRLNAKVVPERVTVEEYRRLVKKKNKFGAVRMKIDGHSFDSKREAKRYQELCLLRKGGRLSHLEVHPKFPLSVRGCPVGLYEADFCYRQLENGELVRFVVEDVKSPATRTGVYMLKKKLFEALYEPFTITEIME